MRFLKPWLYIVLSVACSFLLPAAALAQNKIIKGYIKDALSDERVPFASISFMNSGIGRLSDSAGNFIFHLAGWPSDTLLVTYVGYKDYKNFIGPDIIKNAAGNEVSLIINLDRG